MLRDAIAALRGGKSGLRPMAGGKGPLIRRFVPPQAASRRRWAAEVVACLRDAHAAVRRAALEALACLPTNVQLKAKWDVLTMAGDAHVAVRRAVVLSYAQRPNMCQARIVEYCA